MEEIVEPVIPEEIEKEEPRRVSFQDFMRQLSSTTQSGIPTIPSIPEHADESSVNELESSAAGLESTVSISTVFTIDDLRIKREQSPLPVDMDEISSKEIESIPLPIELAQKTISLNPVSIHSLTDSIARIQSAVPSPIISKADISPQPSSDPRPQSSNQNAEEAPKIANIKPSESAEELATSRTLESVTKSLNHERIWREERLQRERRDSEPVYTSFNREREIPSTLERTQSTNNFRESFPPPANRGTRDYRMETRPEEHMHSPRPRPMRDGPFPAPYGAARDRGAPSPIPYSNPRDGRGAPSPLPYRRDEPYGMGGRESRREEFPQVPPYNYPPSRDERLSAPYPRPERLDTRRDGFYYGRRDEISSAPYDYDSPKSRRSDALPMPYNTPRDIGPYNGPPRDGARREYFPVRGRGRGGFDSSRGHDSGRGGYDSGRGSSHPGLQGRRQM